MASSAEYYIGSPSLPLFGSRVRHLKSRQTLSSAARCGMTTANGGISHFRRPPVSKRRLGAGRCYRHGPGHRRHTIVVAGEHVRFASIDAPEEGSGLPPMGNSGRTAEPLLNGQKNACENGKSTASATSVIDTAGCWPCATPGNHSAERMSTTIRLRSFRWKCRSLTNRTQPSSIDGACPTPADYG
jgi:hypothetical protein